MVGVNASTSALVGLGDAIRGALWLGRLGFGFVASLGFFFGLGLFAGSHFHKAIVS